MPITKWLESFISPHGWLCFNCIQKSENINKHAIELVIVNSLLLFALPCHPVLVRQFTWCATREAPAVDKEFKWEGVSGWRHRWYLYFTYTLVNAKTQRVSPSTSVSLEIQRWQSPPFLCGAHRGCFASELASPLTFQTFAYQLVEKLQNTFWELYSEKRPSLVSGSPP